MKSVTHLVLTPGSLSLAQLRAISRQRHTLALAPEAIAPINTSAGVVQQVLEEGRTVYGINTGFGLLANTKIAPEDLQLLQRSIVLSHAAGFGQYMQDATVRLMMVLKINSLSRGYSGIRLEVIQFLISLVNAEVYPCVP
ncbi:MAG: aromatic amino acid lyase, partial [Shewanella sp.]